MMSRIAGKRDGDTEAGVRDDVLLEGIVPGRGGSGVGDGVDEVEVCHVFRGEEGGRVVGEGALGFGGEHIVE